MYLFILPRYLSINRLVCSKLVGNGVQIAFRSGKIAIETYLPFSSSLSVVAICPALWWQKYSALKLLCHPPFARTSAVIDEIEDLIAFGDKD